MINTLHIKEVDKVVGALKAIARSIDKLAESNSNKYSLPIYKAKDSGLTIPGSTTFHPAKFVTVPGRITNPDEPFVMQNKQECIDKFIEQAEAFKYCGVMEASIIDDFISEIKGYYK